MNTIKIGLLPMYLAMYDKNSPQVRPEIESFYFKIADEFEKRGISVLKTDICRVEKEFEDSVQKFEADDADAVVTLHLAYSPSLESANVLKRTKLPVFILDTTPDYEFGPDQDNSKVMFNHGIHGVQDMCCLLVRNGKSFKIEAGHWIYSDVIDRICNWIRAAHMACIMKKIRVGIIGRPFDGMGDFIVAKEVLRSTIGIETVEYKPEFFMQLADSICKNEIDAEIAKDKSLFEVDDVDENELVRSERAGLAVRKWMEKERLSAFTVNFMDVNKETGLPAAPFLEASKALAEGYGYAGEGDVLTAALVGAIASVCRETTFIEMFCPDWIRDTIYMSHMGEMNIGLADGKPVLKTIPYPYTDADDPVIAIGRYKGGEAVLVNLAPVDDNKYRLIIVPGIMQKIKGDDNMKDTIRGWFKPEIPILVFLQQYSQIGGTHHSALIYGNVVQDIIKFGKIMEWDVRVIN